MEKTVRYSCGRIHFSTRVATYQVEKVDYYNENGDVVYATVLNSYSEHRCYDCGKAWTSGCW